MNRRTLIKTLGISAVGLATVPLWMEAWTEDDLPAVDSELTEDERAQLAALVEVIIPATDSPGAKELGVDKFILTMVADCYEKEIQQEFKDGFTQIDDSCEDQYKKSFLQLNDDQRKEIILHLLSLQKPEGKNINFVGFVKDLSIGGYMSSEYVLTNFLNYEFVPSRWNGSFPVEQAVYNNA